MLILPYIEQQELFDQYRFDEPWDGPHNRELIPKMPRIFAFHNRRDERPTTTNYLAVVGPETMWPGDVGRKMADVTDGLANTILIAENRGAGVVWTEPRDLEFAAMPFEVDHPFGVSSWYEAPAVVTADGSTLRLKKSLSPAALRAALTAAGGEPLGMGEAGWELLPQGRPRE